LYNVCIKQKTGKILKEKEKKLGEFLFNLNNKMMIKKKKKERKKTSILYILTA